MGTKAVEAFQACTVLSCCPPCSVAASSADAYLCVLYPDMCKVVHIETMDPRACYFGRARVRPLLAKDARYDPWAQAGATPCPVAQPSASKARQAESRRCRRHTSARHVRSTLMSHTSGHGTARWSSHAVVQDARRARWISSGEEWCLQSWTERPICKGQA